MLGTLCSCSISGPRWIFPWNAAQIHGEVSPSSLSTTTTHANIWASHTPEYEAPLSRYGLLKFSSSSYTMSSARLQIQS